MANLVSPGVQTTETDKTLSLGQSATTEGGIAGYFAWGPVEKVTTITSEEELVKTFWRPDATQLGDYFFTAASFLAYGNNLRVVRVVDEDRALAATASPSTTAITPGTFTINTSSKILTAVSGNTSALYEGLTLTVANSGVSAVVTIASVANANAAILTVTPTVAVTAGNGFSYGLYVKNDDHYTESIATQTLVVGPWSAKYPGALGNSLRVEVCASANAYSQTVAQGTANVSVVASSLTATFSSNVAGLVQAGDIITVTVGGRSESRSIEAMANNTSATINATFSAAVVGAEFSRKWKYEYLFEAAPSTSAYATARGGSNDELHLVVIDEDGALTGVRGQVLEKYGFLSKASDAKQTDGAANYYKDAINRRSAYVWFISHPSSATNWGTPATGVAFDSIALIDGHSLQGGVSGSSVSDADVMRGYDKFLDEGARVSLIMGGPASITVANYIASTIVPNKPYSMGFVSPTRDTVVNNYGNEKDDIIAFRNMLPLSDKMITDTGWKQMYDKFNDQYRYVPLNGDIAGTVAYTDQTAEPWLSPAAHTRGQIRNLTKLAFNPSRRADRDDLYRNSINPVVTLAGQGTRLYGDKTMLGKPSVFSQIGVRRLFNYLESSIEIFSEQQLFQQNDAYTRQLFISTVEPLLRSVRGRRGITDYTIICDETNNNDAVVNAQEFRADIYVKPIGSINYVYVNFTAVRGSVNFSEIITSNG